MTTLLEALINELRKDLSFPGLFPRSGEELAVRHILEEAEQKRLADLSQFNLIAISRALERHLDSLDEPLFSHGDVLARISVGFPPNTCLSMLPLNKLYALRTLFDYLNEASMRANENTLSVEFLAAVFTPVLFAELTPFNSPSAFSFVQTLISNPSIIRAILNEKLSRSDPFLTTSAPPPVDPPPLSPEVRKVMDADKLLSMCVERGEMLAELHRKFEVLQATLGQAQAKITSLQTDNARLRSSVVELEIENERLRQHQAAVQATASLYVASAVANNNNKNRNNNNNNNNNNNDDSNVKRSARKNRNNNNYSNNNDDIGGDGRREYVDEDVAAANLIKQVSSAFKNSNYVSNNVFSLGGGGGGGVAYAPSNAPSRLNFSNNLPSSIINTNTNNNNSSDVMRNASFNLDESSEEANQSPKYGGGGGGEGGEGGGSTTRMLLQLEQRLRAQKLLNERLEMETARGNE